MTRLLAINAIIAIHRRQIAEHGGEQGLRDRGLLESALSRPANLISYAAEHPDLADLASAYGFGIAKNHPFIDGNKRTALVAMRTFLILNGSDIDATQQDKYTTLMALADGRLTEKQLADWIRSRMSTIQS